MSLSNEQMVELYTTMVKIRMFEENVVELFAAGKIPGFVHLYIGEEAVASGVCACLNDNDYITSTHRGHGH
jgi:TPP-dependent pyruvate/acetoin dehydrogenase alpha subunit